MSLFGRKERRALDELSSELEKRGIALSEDQRSISSIPGYWPEAQIGGQATASVSRALALVPVFGAIRTLADSIASLPMNLYTNDARGIPRRQPTPILFQNPSIHGTVYDWLFRAIASMALQGDAIGLKTQRDFYGFPTMVEWLNPEQVATQDGKLYGPGSYMNPMWWWWGRPINPTELIHVPWFTLPWRVRGLSPIAAFQLTTNIGIGAQEYQANWFGQGGVPPGTFQNSERTIEQKDADKLTSRLTARLQARQPLVYGRDWTYTPIAIKPHEAQFIETVQMTATQVAVIYGLPPRRLGGSTGESMTYSTVEQDNLEYLTLSLRPWLVRLEYALTRCFPPGYYVKFGPEEMLRVDAKTKAEIDSLALGYQNTGWLTQDEVRVGYDRAPIPASQKPPFQHVPVAVEAQKNLNKPTLVSVNGKPVNGNAPQPVTGNGLKDNTSQPHNGSQPQTKVNESDDGSGASGANHALSQTRNGRQAMLELYALRTHDPIGRVKEPDFMRSRVV